MTKKSTDQTLTKVNATIAKNCHAKFDAENGADAGKDWKKGKEIRVVRGKIKKKQYNKKFALVESNRKELLCIVANFQIIFHFL